MTRLSKFYNILAIKVRYFKKQITFSIALSLLISCFTLVLLLQFVIPAENSFFIGTLANEELPRIEDGDDLLAPVSKERTLGDYAPSDLRRIPDYLSMGGRVMDLRPVPLEQLELMWRAADRDDVELLVRSAYRSYSTQRTLFNNYVRDHGEEEANRFSARPGQSEHQLGTTVDFGGTDVDLSAAFANTAAGRWLSANAYRFGFVMSYPDGKEQITGYIFEPWHYRYIGVDSAIELRASGLTLKEYLEAKQVAAPPAPTTPEPTPPPTLPPPEPARDRDEGIPIRRLYLDKREITLAPGEELVLDVRVLPQEAEGQDLTWESNRPGVASVKSVDPRTTAARNPQGQVTAKAEGETRVIVRSASDYLIFDSCLITVSSAAPGEETEQVTVPDTPVEQTDVSDSQEDAGEESAPAETEVVTDASGLSRPVQVLIGLGAAILIGALAAVMIRRNKKTALLPAASVKAVSGYFAGQTIKLKKGQLVIGRDSAEAQLVYPQSNQQISRKHCVIKYNRAEKNYTIIDTSTNGTFLSNGERLTAGKPYILKPGERFYVGDPKELFETG